jgi:hypothetical protein
MLSGFLFLWGGREGMAGVGLLELAGMAFLIWLSNRQPEAHAGGHGHGSHGGHDDAHASAAHGHDDASHAAPNHGSHGATPVAAASH